MLDVESGLSFEITQMLWNEQTLEIIEQKLTSYSPTAPVFSLWSNFRPREFQKNNCESSSSRERNLRLSSLKNKKRRWKVAQMQAIYSDWRLRKRNLKRLKFKEPVTESRELSWKPKDSQSVRRMKPIPNVRNFSLLIFSLRREKKNF